MKKYTILLIVTVLFTMILLSCDNKTENKNDSMTTVPILTTTVSDIETADIIVKNITKENLNEYIVVRPDEANSIVIKNTTDLYNILKTDFAPKMDLKSDLVIPNVKKYSETEKEILIGRTNRKESEEVYKALRYNDYAIELINEKIVICGGSDDATVNAILKFINICLNSKDNTVISADDPVLFAGKYNKEDLLFNGLGVEKYRIVYENHNKNGEKDIAGLLQTAIAEESGWVLDTFSDNKEYNDGYEILIGNTNRKFDKKEVATEENEYVISSNDKFLYIEATSPIAYLTAINQLKDLITGTEKKNMEFDVIRNKVAEDSKIKAMTFNVLVNTKNGDENRSEKVIKMVLNYMPDTVGFQEASPSWMNTLKKGLGQYYDYVGVGRDGGNSGEYNPVFYRKDKFTLIESGTQWLSDTPDKVSKFSESSLNRIYTYALLKRNSDGLEFMHVNTHFDHTSSEARQKQAKVLLAYLKDFEDIPIICTGDFNCKEGTTEYKTVVSGYMKSSSDVAGKAEKASTFHNYGSSSSTIDFIFINPKYVSVQYYRVCNEMIDGNYASDHHPVYIEYYIVK